jgi:hypothetical protein
MGDVRLVERPSHADRVRRRRSEAVPGVKPPSGWVCKQVDVRACRGFAADSLKQDGQDDVTETSPLVLGEHSHVDYVEVSASVAK